MFSTYHPLKKPSLLLLLIIFLLANLPQAALAQQTPASPLTGTPLTVTPTATGVEVTWATPAAVTASAATLSDLLPTARYQGYDLPLQTVTLAVAPDAAPTVLVAALQATELAGALAPGAPVTPPVLDWTPAANIAAEEPAELPTAPAFILREGAVKGQRFVVLAISPIFAENGVVKVAGSFRATVAGATPAGLASLAVAAASQPQGVTEAVAVPVNQAALQNGYRITVSQPGLQEVPFSAFGAGFDSTRLHLTHRGETVAVEVLADRLRFFVPEVGDRWNATAVYWLTFDDGGAQIGAGVAAAAAAAAGQAYERGVWRSNKQYISEYAGYDADHWYNASLTASGTMTQSFPEASATISSVLPSITGQSSYTLNVTVIGAVSWEECKSGVEKYKVKAKFLAGEDVWLFNLGVGFVNELDTASQVSAALRNQFQQNGVQLGDGARVIVQEAKKKWRVIDTDSAYRIQYENDILSVYGDIVIDTQLVTWNPSLNVNGNCRLQENWSLSLATNTAPVAMKTILAPSGVSGYSTSILLDAIAWQRPVALDFGGKGAEFWTDPAAATFTLTNLPAARTLYDVTDPLVPVIVPLGAGASAAFTQADSATPRRYVLANHAAPTTPVVAAHAAVNFGDVLAANAIYIGPARFQEELQPLLALRTQQGYTPRFVDAQAIFDVYGDGYSSAPAIRNFLRDRSDWQNPNRTISVVLVGDGTYDPFNYKNTAFGSDVTHPIPPYMLNVDIYINEAPCESCFAQLNGDNPITGDDEKALNPKSNVFIPDVWLGRFPVRNEAELTAMVAKIVAYESTTAEAGWATTQLFLADNYITSINAQNQVTIDRAGDFAKYSDEVIQLFGYGAAAQRVYYDHSPDRQVDLSSTAGSLLNTTVRTAAEPWRISSIPATNQKAISAINAGVGLMVYNGHSNHWNYAALEDRSGAAAGQLMSIVDVPSLVNGGKLFVGLSMTCLTSQFAAPAVSGTLDELFVRSASGGAVATWGPSGLSVAHGHDYLQKGFISQLRNSPPNSQRMGDLVEAGYNNLLTSPLKGSLDALKTFIVLGDPLTQVRTNVGFDRGLFMPVTQK